MKKKKSEVEIRIAKCKLKETKQLRIFFLTSRFKTVVLLRPTYTCMLDLATKSLRQYIIPNDFEN